MKTQQNIAVHIGFPKTGTRTLQEFVFDRHPQIAYYGQTNLEKNKTAKALIKSIITGREAVPPITQKMLADLSEGRTLLLLSDEAFTLGEFMRRGPIWGIESDHRKTAERIKKILGPVRIHVVFRDQLDLLVSFHRHGLKHEKYNERDFQNWLEKEIGDDALERMFKLMEFDLVYQSYVDVFGANLVNAYWYEDYKDRFPQLAADIAENSGVSADKARDMAGNKARNVTGQDFRATPGFARKVLSNSRAAKALWMKCPQRVQKAIREGLKIRRPYKEIPQKTRERFDQRFAASNERLQIILKHKDETSQRLHAEGVKQ